MANKSDIDASKIVWDESPKPKIDASKVKWDSPKDKSILDNVVNAAKGGLSGVAMGFNDVSKTLAKPIIAGLDLVTDGNASKNLDKSNNKIESDYKREYGDSTAATVGRIGGNVAATWPVGGVLANGLTKLGSILNTTKFAPLAESVASGRFKAAGAGLPTRIAGGAITGAASAGLVNPDDAMTGAVVGGALPPAVKYTAKAANGIKDLTGDLLSNTLGLTTGAGANSVKEAYLAGKNGSTSFLENMRGNVSMDDVIQDAKQGLNVMRNNRANDYRNGMVDIAHDKTIIDYQPIMDVLKNLQNLGNYKGQVINKNSSGTVDEITQQINKWASLDPAQFHTPEGLDALKQSIGDIRDSTQFGTQARKATDTAYNSIKDQIVNQAPTYAKTMQGYSDASKELAEIEKAFSLGNKSSIDTAMRKLQSLMRNNVQTNYGNRLDMANTLSEKGGVDILPSIAGQSMNSWTPRGIQGSMIGGAGGAAAFINPLSLAALPLSSPRLIGESAYKAGSISSMFDEIPKKAGSLVNGMLPSFGNQSLTNQELVQALQYLTAKTAPIVANQ